MLSNTSGGSPGSVTERRQLPAWLPLPSTRLIPLPRLPLYSAVKVTAVPGTCCEAAVSVPSLARTQRKLLAPCCTAQATCVPMSYFRAITGPKPAA